MNGIQRGAFFNFIHKQLNNIKFALLFFLP
jgi:hypothetical protein